MAGRRERLIHLLLKERLGGEAPPDLSSRIMRSLDRPAGVMSARPASFWWVGAAAAMLILAAGLGIYAALREDSPAPASVPQLAQPDHTDAPPVQPTRTLPRPDGALPPAVPDTEPRPQPEKLPSPQPGPGVPPREAPDTGPVEGPVVGPREGPDKGPVEGPVEGPVVGPPQPEPDPVPVPEEGPKKAPNEDPEKGPVVDQPPVPQPEPEPAPKPGPGPGIERRPGPEKGPANPTATPTVVDPAKVALVMFEEDGADLSVRKPGEARFTDWKEGPLAEGTGLKARHAVLLRVGEARVWFEGEIVLGLADGAPTLEVENKAVYVDALATTGAVVVRRGDLTLEVRDAALVAEEVGRKLRLTCLDGELAWGESRLAAGQSALLSGRGFERERDADRDHKLLQAAAKACNLWREDFSAKTGERLLQGEVENGVVVGGAAREGGIGLRLNGRVAGEGESIRLRVRLAAPGNLMVRVVADEGQGTFTHVVEKLPAGRWLTVTIKLSDLRREEIRLPAGAVTAKLELGSKGGNSQKLELDWLEWFGEPANRR